MVCLGLGHVEHPNGRYQRESVQRAIDWILSMQCRNGGWASFDKNNDRMVFQHVPFADHNAMLDPATVDITGRILEMLAAYGYDKNHPAVKKALKFIRDQQEPDGSWFGRWGVNYIYGTMLVLRGLEAMEIDHHEPYCAAGRRVVAHGTESRRRMGRDLRFLRRSQYQGRRPQHPVADGVGHHGIAGRQ